MFCKKCGKKTQPGQKYCVGCGATLEEESAVEPRPAAPLRSGQASGQRPSESPLASAPAGSTRRNWYLLLASVVIFAIVAGGSLGYFLGLNLWQNAAVDAATTTTSAPTTTSVITSTSASVNIPVTASTTVTTSATLSRASGDGQTVKVTEYGATLNLPGDWNVTKALTVDKTGVSWLEATGPAGAFLRCVSETLWTGWKPNPESYHVGDKSNLLKSHPDALDVALGNGQIGDKDALRWEYKFTSNSALWGGIAYYFPRDASFNPSELAIRFPGGAAARAEVEGIFASLRLPMK